MFNLISNNEKSFVLRLLSVENAVREDKREITSFRKISIRKLYSNGQVEVKLGKTVVISQIYAKLTAPFPDRPNEGMVAFSIDSFHLKPNADYNQSNESLNELRTKISNLLEKSLRESKALDTNSLCIIPGKLVWKIVVDINIINYDGNVCDACVLATLSSWLSYKIPFLRRKGEKVFNEGKSIYLTMLHRPISVTFGVFNCKDQVKFIADCTLKEEIVMNGFVTVSANSFGEICYMQMSSNAQVSEKEMHDMLLLAHDKIKELYQVLKEFLEKAKSDDKKEEKEEEDKMKVDDDIKELKRATKEDLKGKKHFEYLSYKQ